MTKIDYILSFPLGGARGPGVFFIIPCVDTYEKIDMRSRKYEIPPQEVNEKLVILIRYD